MVDDSQLETKGRTLGWMPAWFYDGLVHVCTLGKEEVLRQEIVDLAGIQFGDKVLDVGCGTGSLTILAAEDVGTTGEIVGIDPSSSLLKRAKTKANNKMGITRPVRVRFEQGLAEAIPAPDESFDVILCTFCFHHLPGGELQYKALAEMKRVLRPNGKLLVVDFPEQEEQGHHHHHHHHSPHACCGSHAEPSAPGNDPIVKRIEKSGFVDVKAQHVRMMGGIAILAFQTT